MTVHKEGYTPIALCILFIFVLNAAMQFYAPHAYVTKWFIYILSFLFFVATIFFFRGPSFKVLSNKKLVLSPAHGKVVSIEEVEETEVLNEKCIQLTLSALTENEYADGYFVITLLRYFQYQPAKYYLKNGHLIEGGGQFDSIRSVSMIEMFLPIGTKVNVVLNEVVEAGSTLAELPA